MMTKSIFVLLAMISIMGAQPRGRPAVGYRDWQAYGGGPDSIRYSTLTQINRSNVHRLRVAWTYDTGDAFPGSEMQCNPIVVDGTLFATTPKLRVIALHAATGKLKWSFEPEGMGRGRNRGVVYWADGTDQRVFTSCRSYLYALDARTGRPMPGFGKQGRIDLREGLGRDPDGLPVMLTTPGVIYKDLLIVGHLTSEGLPSAPGDIRAFDVRTGKLRWSFHTIPHPGEFGHATWPPDAWRYIGGANSWPGLALDVRRGIVYAPTGSAAFDFFGSNRIGDNLFANSLLALKADTGERLWHFQFVKHDVWDRDLPAPPTLVTVRRGGKLIDAVAQVTKSGHVFVFDRQNGTPLFPIEYRQVPASEVNGEVLARTQPFPLKPPPFSRQELREDMLSKRTGEVNKLLVERFRSVLSAGQFAPPSLKGTIVFPGFDGGAEWGGAAFDPETGLLYVNANEMAWILRLVPRTRGGRASGRVLYVRHCAACHREDLGGSPPAFPSLIRITERRRSGEIESVVRKGEGRMPGFEKLGQEVIAAITRYLTTGEDVDVKTEDRPGPASPIDLPYTTDGYNKFLDPEGYPAVEPPWGTLNAIDLDKGEIAWKIPLGEFPKLAAQGMRNTGTENYGGPIVTAGGLLFIGATNHDNKFRVYDKSSGKLLWETTLPAAGNATPAMFELNGRQMVIVGAGGGKSGAPSGGTYIAFSLPD
jgi:quinoprotein glucose dehydrogenase